MNEWSFFVIDNHPKMSRNFCELCGSEIDRQGNALNSPENDSEFGDISLCLEVIRWFARWHLNKPEILRIIAIKLEHPEYSIRDIEKLCNVKRSSISVMINEAIQIKPLLSKMLGMETPKARGQKQRRNNERKQYEQDSQ